MSKDIINQSLLRKLSILLQILMLLALSACGIQSEPARQPSAENNVVLEDDFDYTLSVEITAASSREDIEDLYSGSVVVWRPEAGFAIVGVKGGSISTFTVPADSNEDTFEAPILATAAGVEGSGFAAWSGGFAAWSGGFPAWSGGFPAWSGGFPAWSGGFAAWSGGFPAWSGGFAAWSGGELTYSPMDNLDMWLQIGLPEAHFFLAPNLGEDVVIAVIDTGVDLDHPAFVGRLVDGYDFVDNDNDPDEVGGGNAFGHGTGVAGIILQVAPQAKIMPIRVLNEHGQGDTDDIAEAVDWAVQHGADVINLSLGSNEESVVLNTLVEYAAEQGVYLVSSAGNSGLKDKVTHPAARANAGGALGKRLLSVGSVDVDDIKSDFSNYGSGLEILAPGESLFTTGPEEQFTYWTGTSFAAPIAAASLALALGEDIHNDYRSDLANYMGDFANEIKDLPGNDAFGSGLGDGRLNIADFLRALELVDYGDPFIIEAQYAWDLNFDYEDGEVNLRVQSLTSDYNHANIDANSITLQADSGEIVQPNEVNVGSSYTDITFTNKRHLLELFADQNIAPGTVKTLTLSFAIDNADVKDYQVEVSFEDSDKLWIDYAGEFAINTQSAWDLNFDYEDGEVTLRVQSADDGYNHLHMKKNSITLHADSGEIVQPDEVNIGSNYTDITFTNKRDLLGLFTDQNIEPGTVKTLTLSFAINNADVKDYQVEVSFEDSDKLWINTTGEYVIAQPSTWDLNFASERGLETIRVYNAEGDAGYNHRHLNTHNVILQGDSNKDIKPKEVSISSDYTDLEFDKEKLLELFEDANIAPGSVRSFTVTIELEGAEVRVYTVSVTFTDEDELWVNYDGGFNIDVMNDWDRNFSYAEGSVKILVSDAAGGYNQRHIDTSSIQLMGNNKSVNPDEVKLEGDYLELVFEKKANLFELLGDNDPTPGSVFPLTLSFSLADAEVSNYGITVTVNDTDRSWVNYNGSFTVEAADVWNLKKHHGEYKDVKFRIYDADGGYNHVHVNASSLELYFNGDHFNKIDISIKDGYTEVKIRKDDVKDFLSFLDLDSDNATINLELSFSFADSDDLSYAFSATVEK